jgi:hypothetical protein
MFHRTRMLGVAAVVFGAVLAVPAVASAVTATLNHRCYSHVPTRGSEPIVISLAGGTPNADFIVAATVPGKGTGSAGSTDGTFDAAGNATAQILDVALPSGTIDPTRGQTIQLSVQDFGAGGVDTPIAQTLVTTLSMSIADRPVSPRARRVVRVSGTPFAGKRLYGFVVKPNSSHVLRRISLGRGDICGFVSTKAVVAPPSYRAGRYRFYVNAGRKLNKREALYSTFQISHRF